MTFKKKPNSRVFNCLKLSIFFKFWYAKFFKTLGDQNDVIGLVISELYV